MSFQTLAELLEEHYGLAKSDAADSEELVDEIDADALVEQLHSEGRVTL